MAAGFARKRVCGTAPSALVRAGGQTEKNGKIIVLFYHSEYWVLWLNSQPVISFSFLSLFLVVFNEDEVVTKVSSLLL